MVLPRTLTLPLTLPFYGITLDPNTTFDINHYIHMMLLGLTFVFDITILSCYLSPSFHMYIVWFTSVFMLPHVQEV